MRAIMTLICLVVIGLYTTASQAISPSGVVFKYECAHIDPTKTGFACLTTENGLRIEWREHTKEMGTEKKELAIYEFNKIVLRYLQLGWRHFDVVQPDWPKNKKRPCYRPKGWPDYKYTCQNPCVWEELEDGGQACTTVEE